MSAKLKFRTDRREWVVQCHQFGQRWKQQVADEPTGKAVAKAINARMRQGEDMRPASTRTAATPRPPSGGDTVRTFGDRWLLDGWGSRKATTNDFYAGNLRLHIYPVLGDVPLAKLTRPTCVAFIKGLLAKTATRRKRPIARATRAAIRATLTAMLGAAVEADAIPVNPAVRMNKHLSSPDEIEVEIQPWTATEADRFLETVRARRPEYYAFFFVALRTGLRLGELLELRWDRDFEHAPDAIHVQRSFSSHKRTTLVVAADGTHTREVVDTDRVTSPKGKRSRLVDTSAAVTRVLDAHRVAAKAAGLQRGDPALGLVFTTARGTRLDGSNLFGRVMRPMIRAARVRPLHIHGLRHTYATTLLMKGVELAYVSRQLGHANVTTTERHYRHWVPDAAADAARRRRLDDVWNVDARGGE